jgi:hypothetical protein
MRTLKHITAGLLIVTTASCAVVSTRVDVTAVPPTEPAEIAGALKVHLKDGSTVVYQSGATITSTEIRGEGTRYPLEGKAVAVTTVMREEVTGMESYRQVTNTGKSIGQSLLMAGAGVGLFIAVLALSWSW